MMDSIRKTSQRTLIVYALFFSLFAAGRCFQGFIDQQHMAEIVFAFSKNQVGVR